jgi:hypothetical protein
MSNDAAMLGRRSSTSIAATGKSSNIVENRTAST